MSNLLWWWRCRRYNRLVLVILVCSLTIPLVCRAQTSSASEDDVRAAMVSHLPLFVEWPAAKVDVTHPQFRVCLLGADPIGPALEAAFHNAATLPMPIVFSRVSLSDHLESCYLLYIGSATRGNLYKLIAELAQSSVLTVSERPIDLATGEVIGLPLEENHVRIEVNLGAAQKSKLIISSRLLSLATMVRRP